MTDAPIRWNQLLPEESIAAALEHAGPRPADESSQNEKRAWSERFANACAVAIAAAFRRSALSTKRIRPESLEAGTEPLTPLGSGTKKRIDVTIADPLLGLEVGVSLKGLNFRDSQSNNYDKNLTGRLYELGDEVRVVHEHLPHAFMAAVFFLPLESTADKTERAPSSFANAVVKLRSRTGRLDASLPGQAAKCDLAFVALYSLGGSDPSAPARGVLRFFNVERDPPRRGRPKVLSTVDISGMVDECVTRATLSATMTWSEPEDE